MSLKYIEDLLNNIFRNEENKLFLLSLNQVAYGGLAVPAPALGQYASIVTGRAGFPPLQGVQRGRSSSVGGVKRPRLDDVPDVPRQRPAEAGGQANDRHVENTDRPNTPGWEQPGRRGHRSQKAVVGTGGGSLGRKMKTARADIFIYAVDQSTTVGDIVEGLALNQIEVSPSHVVKKTRTDVQSRFDCYRISVKQEDMDKSLQPDMWPMGVRVRQWVHYRQQGGQGGPAGPGGHVREGQGLAGGRGAALAGDQAAQ